MITSHLGGSNSFSYLWMVAVVRRGGQEGNVRLGKGGMGWDMQVQRVRNKITLKKNNTVL